MWIVVYYKGEMPPQIFYIRFKIPIVEFLEFEIFIIPLISLISHVVDVSCRKRLRFAFFFFYKHKWKFTHVCVVHVWDFLAEAWRNGVGVELSAANWLMYFERSKGGSFFPLWTAPGFWNEQPGMVGGQVKEIWLRLLPSPLTLFKPQFCHLKMEIKSYLMGWLTGRHSIRWCLSNGLLILCPNN